MKVEIDDFSSQVSASDRPLRSQGAYLHLDRYEIQTVLQLMHTQLARLTRLHEEYTGMRILGTPYLKLERVWLDHLTIFEGTPINGWIYSGYHPPEREQYEIVGEAVKRFVRADGTAAANLLLNGSRLQVDGKRRIWTPQEAFPLDLELDGTYSGHGHELDKRTGFITPTFRLIEKGKRTGATTPDEWEDFVVSLDKGFCVYYLDSDGVVWAEDCFSGDSSFHSRLASDDPNLLTDLQRRGEIEKIDRRAKGKNLYYIKTVEFEQVVDEDPEGAREASSD